MLIEFVNVRRRGSDWESLSPVRPKIFRLIALNAHLYSLLISLHRIQFIPKLRQALLDHALQGEIIRVNYYTEISLIHLQMS